MQGVFTISLLGGEGVNKRKNGCMSIILTLNSQNKDIDIKEAEKSIKRLLDALRWKAKQEGWWYYIYIGYSKSNQKIITKNPHFHVFLYAEPCETVARWINNYWNPPKTSKRRRFGIVKRQAVEASKAGYFIYEYIRGQAEFMREQSYNCNLSEFLRL